MHVSRPKGLHRFLTLDRLAAVLIPLLFTLVLYSGKSRLPPDREFLGFVHIDQPSYYAAAREVFENGNGLTYASPYSNLPDSARIYSSFVFLVFGYLWKFFGLSFTAIDYGLRAIFGVVMLLLVVEVIRAALPSQRFALFGSLAAISCGGLAWAVALVRAVQDSLMNGPPDASSASLADWATTYADAFSQAEGGYGEWQMSIFRNLTYTPEILYHVLFFACVLCVLRRRIWTGLIFLTLTWWSHPFTGLELGMILSCFLLCEGWLGVPRGWRQFSCSLLVNASFVAYYLLFLPRFPEHASVYAQMRDFGNPMLFSMLLPAFGLFLFLPAFYLATARFRAHLRRRPGVRLLSIWLIVVGLLVFHDRILHFMKPVQPLHFGRGYLFVPLVCFSVCGLRRILGPAGRKRRTPAYALFAILLLLHLPDNLMALGLLRNSLPGSGYPYSISKENSALLMELDSIEATETIYAGLASSELEFFIPVLTHHRALLAHRFNTPYRGEKEALAAEWRRAPSREVLRRLALTALLVDDRGLALLDPSLFPDEREVLLTRGSLHLVRLHLRADNRLPLISRSTRIQARPRFASSNSNVPRSS